MKKHIFRLQKVLKAKKIKQDVEQRKLMSEQQKLREEQESLEQLNRLESQMMKDLKKQWLSRTKGHEIRNYHLYQYQVQKYVEQQETEVHEAHSKVEKQREVLIDAVKDKRILDKLKERDYKSYIRRQDSREQRQLDEISQIQPMRKQKS